MPLINRRTVAGGHIPGIEDVLDPHRNAMERTFWFSPVTVSGLWEKVREKRNVGTFERFVLAANLLFLMGIIDFSDGMLSRIEP